ncbi:MAG: hypothetical protein ACLS2Y_08355 [Mediterraneibacter faecis]|jgi:hypothetical protein
MLESKFQSKLIRRIKDEFPGCIVLKNDPTYLQGIPDLTIFYENTWATLEVKKSAKASHQPNQDYYVDKMNQMSYAAFIFPENEDEVMAELQNHFNT